MSRYLRIVCGLLGILLLLAAGILVWSPGWPSPGEKPSEAPEVDSERSSASEASDSPSDRGSVPPEITPPDENAVARLRQTFRPSPQVLGTPGSPEDALVLKGLVIHPGGLPRVTLSEEPGQAVYWVQLAGPPTREHRAFLASSGGTVHGYLPHRTLLVRMSASTAKRLARERFINWIHPVLPEAKLDPFLTELRALDDPAVPETLPVTVTTYEPEDVDAVVEVANALGWPVQSATRGKRWGWVTLEAELADLDQVAALGEVQWLEEDVPPTLFNDVSVEGPMLNLTNLWAVRGLTGKGQIIGHADTGLDTGSLTNLHPDLADRLVAAYALGRSGNWSDTDGHGTHTAGSILGGGVLSTGQFRGTAFEASLVHQSVLDPGGGLGGLPDDLNDLFRQAYDDQARIHSDSWGASVFGSYTTDARQSDEFMWDHPDMLLVFAAGNAGYDGDANGVVDPGSVGAPATAKNVLSVGASENARSPGSGGYSLYTYGWLWPWDYPASPVADDRPSESFTGEGQGIAAFSSRGPTLDGRIKPEVVAPGTDIVSLRSRAPGSGTGWGAHPNPGYAFSGGTSMSTPLIAGVAALVREYYQEEALVAKPSAALLKATLVQSARTLSPGQYGTNAFREISAQLPNIVEGWGQPDIEALLYPDDGTSWFFLDEREGLSAPGADATLVFHADTGTPVSLTLVWTDYPASAGAGKTLVNDLDLSVAGPDGAVYRPGYAGGFDRSNNLERVTFLAPVAGIHTARVHAFTVPEGPQPFALVGRGPVTAAPVIEHEPLPNTIVTDAVYRVEARVFEAPGSGATTVTLYWREASSTGGYQAVSMTATQDNRYIADLPAHPNPSEIRYYLEAEVSGLVTVHPAGAPATAHTFRVTGPVSLDIMGSPAPVLAVAPAYGTHIVASGNVVRFSAPAWSNLVEGTRLAMNGWTGFGSLPAAGTSVVFDAVLRTNSSLTWQWLHQYQLSQTTDLPGVPSTGTWWFAWSPAETVPALAEVDLGGGLLSGPPISRYGFVGWWVDGVRHPDATSPGSLVATNLIMFGPRSAEARYLPADEDSDADGLPDWWEWFHFGSLDPSATGDADLDGFTNLKEFEDRTSPRDGGDTPQAPSIAHVPLGDPRTSPAPWAVSAVVTDNHAVDTVTLAWSRNGEATNTMTLGLSLSNRYEGFLPTPGTNHDSFVYQVEATDDAGLRSVAGMYGFAVRYPRLAVTPAALTGNEVGHASITSLLVSVTNAGLAPLRWRLDRYAWLEDVESGTNALTHAGANDAWHIRADRSSSPSHAWHFGNGPGGLYPDAADASLVLPAFSVPPDASLLFDHWARMEYDSDQQDDHYWDGGVLELSTNGGATFVQVEPVGGYPHRITENPDSPFPPETPCYGETDGWETGRLDLSGYGGQELQVRFRFGSDFYVREEGWYIDNVRLVVSNAAWWSWLSAPATGTVEAGTASNLVVQLDTGPLDAGGVREATLGVTGNDPENPRWWVVPVDLENLARRLDVSADGPGQVTPSGQVFVNRGGDTQVVATADAWFEIGGILTNGWLADSAAIGLPSAVIAWTNVVSNGTLRVTFREQLATGGVPVWWLVQEGFTNAPPDQEASTDHDGDGLVTWQEYQAQTDALNPTSVALIVSSVHPEDTNSVVEWLSFTNLGYRYRVEASPHLPDGFAVVSTNLPATPPVNVFTNPDPRFLFYRVIREAAP